MIHQITVAKITGEEVEQLRTFLTGVGDKVKELDGYAIDCEEFNEEVGKLVRALFPQRAAFVAPLNLDILLDNYQDEESEILQHPKWINDIYDLLKDLDKHLSSSNAIYPDLGFLDRIKKLLE